MKLVADAKDMWRWHSTHALTAATMLPVVWQQMPEDVKSQVPESWMPWVFVALLIGGLIGRVRDQHG